jgi:hypothetical protein
LIFSLLLGYKERKTSQFQMTKFTREASCPQGASLQGVKKKPDAEPSSA